MDGPFGTMRRLHDRGPGARGLVVDRDGVMLGPDCVLVERTSGGYRCARPDEITRLRRIVFENDRRLDRLPDVLAGIAAALDRDDLVKAQLLGLEIPLDPLDDRKLERLARASALRKAGFNADEPRVPAGEGRAGGQWTREGAGTAAAAGSVVAAEAGGVGSLLGPIGRTVLAGLEALGAAVSGSAAAIAAGGLTVLGTIFIPFNRSLVAEGALPDHPDVTYRFDEGEGTLTLTRDGAQLAAGHDDGSGLFRDRDGRVIGRRLDSSVMIDPDVVPALSVGSGAAAQAGAKAEVRARARDEPKLCPDEGPDRGGNKPPRAVAYQTQITGLPPGLGVELNGVTFDGCRKSDGTMLEAKGPGYLWAMISPTEWRKGYRGREEMEKQMRDQHKAAGNRLVEWHVAEKQVADYLRTYAADNGYANIIVIHTPAVQQ